ncbi:HEAT repeat domain-containing protein [Planktothrix sp. FACHB-1355]|uniref:HEAT repeat domain-containing protein n=1 Tax=Aerosakkonema funiforme FACHB-1375 TaxID=2949571 RepID=A0A926ZEK8_9CYAN|nr:MULTISPECIES: HEAT repeat domain-containing protein [Oscillatoriales]MBD2179754.1 HEAT repeat domain-containing protein [Aerosakkonema funiforme FACHB-1375]MBD3558485.1 HEAT repeat domain-containing protein [Planktothrix sp. FACHB-1355]
MNALNINNSEGSRDLDIAWLIQQLRRASTPTDTVSLIQTLSARKTTVENTEEIIAAFIEILSHHHPSVPAAAVEGLVKLAPHSVEPLIAAFRASADHGLQAYIVQALAKIGDGRALDLLLEVVGVEVANHCQGNVRRVAARGLGRIGSTSGDLEMIKRAIEKLTWALLKTEDWALRYAATVSLQEIATVEAIASLQQALTQEQDNTVQTRIKTALEEVTS